MSSILKALKKLEDEQAGRAASLPGRSRGQFVAPMRSRQPLLLLMFGIGAGLLLAGGLYALFGRSDIQVSPPAVLQTKKAEVPAPMVVPTTDTTVAVNVATVVLPEISPRPASVPAVSPTQPAAAIPDSPRTAKTIHRPAKTIPSGSMVDKPRSAMVPSVPSVSVSAPEIPIDSVERVQVERREIPLPGQQWSAPRLTVSEILSTSAGGRMAIVNGMPVMEGTMVEEALVEKIGADQVVFVVDGRTVMVPLAQPGPTSDRQ
jgi:hypothetical protein